MHIAFDNPFRLARRTNYFEYDGIRFKLIQNNPRRWADVLITLRPSFREKDVQPAVSAAGSFASAFSWFHDVGTTVRHIGGVGVPDSYRLRQAPCRAYDFPHIAFQGNHIGYTLSQISHIANDTQRLALAMYREAQSANKAFLAVLLNWQILEIGGNDPVGWVNKLQRNERKQLDRVEADIKRLAVSGRRLGEFLQDEYRDAVAHIRRIPGRRTLKFDDDTDSARVHVGSRVIRHLARIYIRERLGVTKRRFLLRDRPHGFPTYIDEDASRGRRFFAVR